MARVLVTDAGLGSAVAVIRSLGRRGVHVVAADSDPYSAGFYSRFTRARVRYPPARSAPDAMIATLLRAAREHRVDLIVPVTDETILPLSRAREHFLDVCALALPDAPALAKARDKEATLDLAGQLGVPTPRTALVTTAAEARMQSASLGWPVVLKPQASRVFDDGGEIRAMSVGYAAGFARLAEQMRRFEGRCAVLLQEYYRGEAHGVELLLHRGRPLAAFQHRRLREVPITGGASSLRESVRLDPVLYDYAVQLLAALDWTGLAMVEFKLGEEGPRLMEINGRIWGSLPLAVRSGMDFPARLVDLYLTGPPNGDGGPDASYSLGVRSRHIELEAVWIASVLRRKRRYPFLPMPTRREAMAAALRLLDASDGYDILARDDPRPGLAEMLKIATKPIRRARGR